METPLKVLLIEDREEDALLLERELKRGGLFPRCIRIETEDALRQKLHDESWDVLIADYSLPQFDGLKAFDGIRGHDPVGRDDQKGVGLVV